MRLEDVTALQAIAIIVKAKGLFMDKIDNVYYIKTGAERTAEPTESDSYQFSYARAKDIAPLSGSPTPEQGRAACRRANEHDLLSRDAQQYRQYPQAFGPDR